MPAWESHLIIIMTSDVLNDTTNPYFTWYCIHVDILWMWLYINFANNNVRSGRVVQLDCTPLIGCLGDTPRSV